MTTTSSKFDVIAWMTENGHPGYANEIHDVRCNMDEIKGEAGPNWQICPFTQARLKSCEDQISEIVQSAQDRFDDWASD